jgi:glycosyltransferase involved in cell wall biosynthesis
MNKPGEVSLYIPCFNAAKTILSCLEGVFSQSYPIKEVVVIDDGSTDETLKKIANFKVRVVGYKKNYGLAASRNTALKNIDTGFVASLDADCVPQETWLECLMQNFDSLEIAGVGGRLVEKDISEPADLWRSVHMRQHWGDEKMQPPFLFGSNTVFRREALINAGFYNETFKSNYEDVDICNRLKTAGYAVIYEPKAIAQHLRRDDLISILDNYWKWHLGYYQEEKLYSDMEKFVFKLKENIGTANRYLQEDAASGRPGLLYLDFLLALHHSLKDLGYFISKDRPDSPGEEDQTLLSSWLALLDLVFFYRFDPNKDDISTFISSSQAFSQNFFALVLIVGSSIADRFKNDNYKKILLRHLSVSLFGFDDPVLLDKVSELFERRRDWSGFLRRPQPNLNKVFLEALSFNLKRWLDDLSGWDPAIFEKIEASAQQLGQ